MDSDIVFISHGDIILDNIYDGDLNLIKQDGGGSNWNSLYNLASMGEVCYAIGSYGNDDEGAIAVNSLRNGGINVNYLICENISTDIMNIIIPNEREHGDNSIIHSWYSPITNKSTMHFSENLPTTLPIELENKDLFILLDKFEDVNFRFINNISNKKVCLDVGHVRFIEHFSKQYLTCFFKCANLIQLNTNVIDLLFERLCVNDVYEFFNLFNLDLLVITKGKKGASFIFKDKTSKVICIDKSPEVIATVIDSSGAGDAFFATLVKEYAYSDCIDDEFINTTFCIANKASRDVISQVGSRLLHNKNK